MERENTTGKRESYGRKRERNRRNVMSDRELWEGAIT